MPLPKHKEQPRQEQLQLELPDYSQAYLEWKRKQEQKKEANEETVVIIDIY